MKKAFLTLVLLCIMVLVVACSNRPVAVPGPSPQPLDIIEAFLDVGTTSTALTLGSSRPIPIAGVAALRIKFNQPLSGAYKDVLGREAVLADVDTVRLILPAKDSEVIIPHSLKSASGQGIIKSYTFSFAYTPKASSSSDLELEPERLTGAYAEMINTNSRWSFDPTAVDEVVVCGEATVVFTTTKGKTIIFEAKPGVDYIRFSLDGVDYNYPVKYLPAFAKHEYESTWIRVGLRKYPELGIRFGCTISVLSEDELTLTFSWPFLEESIEAKLRQALGSSLVSMQWLSPMQLALLVKGSPGEEITFSMEELRDIYGYVHPPLYFELRSVYTLRFYEPSVIRRLSPTGQVEEITLPFLCDDALDLDEANNRVTLVRHYPGDNAVESGHWWQQFVFDLSNRQVIGTPLMGYSSTTLEQQIAGPMIYDKGPEQAMVSHLGVDSTQTKAAALFCLPSGNSMVVHDSVTNKTTSYDLISKSDNDGGGAPRSPVYWAANDTYLVYAPWEWPTRIFALELSSGKETLLWNGECRINSVSPVGESLIVSTYTGETHTQRYTHYWVDFTGRKQALVGITEAIGITQWLSPSEILAVRQSQNGEVESFFYDLSKHALQVIGPGRAFDIDSLGYIYLLDN